MMTVMPQISPDASDASLVAPRCPVRSWLLHGITIRACSDADRYLDALDKALRLPRSSDDHAADCLDVSIQTNESPAPPAWVKKVTLLWSHGAYRLCRIDGDPAVLYGEAGWARLFTADRRIVVAGAPSLIGDEFSLTQLLFMPLLSPALRPWGLLPLHACAVDWHGQALVFPASSGSGKSTLALALLRGGFKLISDDMPILQRRVDGSFRLLPFPERSRVRPQSIDFFPELMSIRDRAEQSGDKVLLDPEAIFGDCYVSESRPVAIVLPRIAHAPHSIVGPAAPSVALAALISGLAFGSTGETMGALLPVLCRFVESCRTYTLETGWDFDHLPALLRPLLESG